ncbi:MAG: diacylglycerol/lipid kinase family protein [Gemmatimonadaceae bacterium]
MRRVLLVANPASRRGTKLRAAALGAFAEAGIECETELTDHPGHAGEICRARAAGFDAVFALGGDGTAMEVVGALANSGQPVAILPGGTGNLIARALGTPLVMRRAVRALIDGELKRVDLGILDDGRRFAFAAGVGIDSQMIENTSPWLKRFIGVGAYVFAAAGAIFRRQNIHVRATVDGELIEREAASVMLTNFGAVLNDRLSLGPGIRQDDGKLDLCVFSPGGLTDAIRILWRLARKDFRTDPCMLFRAGAVFRIETDPPCQAQADGDLLGPTPFGARVEPLAATLLVPRRK